MRKHIESVLLQNSPCKKPKAIYSNRKSKIQSKKRTLKIKKTIKDVQTKVIMSVKKGKEQRRLGLIKRRLNCKMKVKLSTARAMRISQILKSLEKRTKRLTRINLSKNCKTISFK